MIVSNCVKCKWMRKIKNVLIYLLSQQRLANDGIKMSLFADDPYELPQCCFILPGSVHTRLRFYYERM